MWSTTIALRGSTGFRLAVALIAALVLTLGWTAAASAQSSMASQYGSSTSSGETVIAQIGAESGDPEEPAAEESGEEPAAEESGVLAAVLPETGGTMLPLFALMAFAVFAVSATALFAVRRSGA